MEKLHFVDACVERHFQDMSLLHALEEVLRRLRAAGYPGCFLYVLRENDRARRFYEAHGFAWDGRSLAVALTPETVLTDLRYRRKF